MRGRPSVYTSALADEICDRLAAGESLQTICAAQDVPHAATVYRWLDAHPDFREKYVRAREAQAEHYADELVDIADAVAGERESAVVHAAKLRVDTRKWIAAQLLPKKYGNRIDHTHHHQTDPADLSDAELAAIIAGRKDGAE